MVIVNTRRRLAASVPWALAAAAAGVVCVAQADASTRVQAWGFNRGGQIGDGTFDDRITPTDVKGLPSNVTAVSVGSNHMMALAGGLVYTWGSNSSGQLGIGESRGDGDFVTPQVVPGLTDVSLIQAGGVHSLAVRNGALYSWGAAFFGEVGNGAGGNPDQTSVYSPYASTTLKSGVTSIAAGFNHSLAVANGSAYAFGFNLDSQAGIGNDTYDPDVPTPPIDMGSGVTAVYAGDSNSFGIKNGQVYSWGQNDKRQLAAGYRGEEVKSPTLADDNVRTGVTAIAGGGSHTLFIKDGIVFGIGANDSGQLGRGPGGTPTGLGAEPIYFGGTMTSVAAGSASSYAVRADGWLFVWGSNFYGELGLGTTGGYNNRPQYILPPAGYAYTTVSALGHDVATILARPDAAMGTTAVGTVLAANGPSPATPAVAGAVAIDPQLASSGSPLLVRLALADPAQAAALIANLNILYGDGTASAIDGGGTYQVQLLLASAAGTPNFFNFDFTTVVAAGPLDPLGFQTAEYGSVPVVGVSVIPEPAALGVLTAAATGLLGRRRRQMT